MKTRILDASEGIGAAAQLLAEGWPVALPTETVYGLGADALNPTACARIFEAKDRPLYDPLIVHIPDLSWMDRLAHIPPAARQLAEAFWPGPLSLVVPRTEIVPDIVTSGQGTVALRMSAHPVFQQVATRFGGPIAAPSANRFGRISPTSARHVLDELDGRIPMILDGGACSHGVESTIVLVREETLHILRHGPLTAEQLASFGPVLGGIEGISSPGNIQSHYAPRTPLVLSPAEAALSSLPRGRSRKIGLLSWDSAGAGFERVEFLTKSRDLREAAANLYGAMRRLDAAGLDLIVAEPVPETGLGSAIMERLRKAAAR